MWRLSGSTSWWIVWMYKKMHFFRDRARIVEIKLRTGFVSHVVVSTVLGTWMAIWLSITKKLTTQLLLASQMPHFGVTTVIAISRQLQWMSSEIDSVKSSSQMEMTKESCREWLRHFNLVWSLTIRKSRDLNLSRKKNWLRDSKRRSSRRLCFWLVQASVFLQEFQTSELQGQAYTASLRSTTCRNRKPFSTLNTSRKTQNPSTFWANRCFKPR